MKIAVEKDYLLFLACKSLVQISHNL